MLKYTIRRILAAVPVLFGLSIILFAFIHLLPGDPVAALLGQLEPNAASSSAPAPAFLQWLVDPDDPSATAFWELLACARRSGGLRRQPGTAGEAASASEAA